MSCEICGRSDGRVVRDHNHQTGMIRGMLCERRNCWLGIYESNNQREKQRGRRRYREWATTFATVIERYLLSETTIPYVRKKDKRDHSIRISV